MSLLEDRKVIYEKIRSYLDSGEGSYEELLTELYEGQAKSNPLIQTYSRSKILRSKLFQEISPVDIDLFKSEVGDVSPFWTCEDDVESVWHSSGSTSGVVSRTPLGTNEAYNKAIDISILGTPFEKALSRVDSILLLVPTRFAWPHSSLAYMYGYLAQGKSFYYGVWAQDEKPSNLSLLKESSESLLKSGKSVGIFTTSYMGVKLLEGIKTTIKLPEGSFIVDTGGYKGVVRDHSRQEFKELVKSRLKLEDEFIFSEYGMSELSSQFWSEIVDGEELWRIPPSVKVELRDVNEEGVGRVIIHDLLNIWSVCSIITGDLGRLVEKKGQTYFVPEGRDKGTPAKGCSLTAERAFGDVQ